MQGKEIEFAVKRLVDDGVRYRQGGRGRDRDMVRDRVPGVGCGVWGTGCDDRVPKVGHVRQVPLTACVVVGPVITEAGEIDPLRMAELVTWTSKKM